MEEEKRRGKETDKAKQGKVRQSKAELLGKRKWKNKCEILKITKSEENKSEWFRNDERINEDVKKGRQGGCCERECLRKRAKKIVWKGGGKRKRKEGRAIQKICEENQKRSSVQRKRGLSKGQGEK